VRASVVREAGRISVDVEDTGAGVPEAERQAIFRPLRRGASLPVDRNPEGHGLGLAIAARIVERHGGTLSVEEGAEGGARFIIRLQAPGDAPSPVSEAP
jgi:two-component system OmpR family sensor kinase